MNIRFNIFGKRILFQFDMRKNRTDYVEGYTNRCKDGKYIVMLDYDRLNIDWVIPEIERLQQDFNLSDFYIFKSSEDSYHAVCFDKLLYHEYVNVLRSSTVDKNYIDVPMKFGKKVWVLRTSDKDKSKIKYCFRIMSHHTHIREKSSAHIELLESLFEGFIYLNSPDESRIQDNKKEVMFARYPI